VVFLEDSTISGLGTHTFHDVEIDTGVTLTAPSIMFITGDYTNNAHFPRGREP
jgi:hypothetical protein